MAVDRGPEKSIADQKGEKLTRTRVGYLVADLHRMGHEAPSRDVVAHLVQETFLNGLTLKQKDELVELTLQAVAHRTNGTGDQEEKVTETAQDLTTERVEALARSYLEAHPKATAAKVWKHVSSHGAPPMNRVSFSTYTMVKIRKEMGIQAGGTKRKAKPKPKPASPKKAKPAAAKKPDLPRPAAS